MIKNKLLQFYYAAETVYRVSQKKWKPFSIPYYSKTVQRIQKFYIPFFGILFIRIYIK